MLVFRQSLTLLLTALLIATTSTTYAQSNQLTELNWQYGPTTASIGSEATIQVPNGYVFLGNMDTKKLMVMLENIPGDNEYVFAPSDLRWFAVFQFSDVGYVKDDETLDADLLLNTVTRGTEQANVERRKRGWSIMTILGWKFQPRYDKRSHLLEWAFLAKEDRANTEVVNYNTRLLGRTGVMQAVLVAEPQILSASVSEFKNAIRGFSFNPGERYAEYRKGDRVAKFGLAALITGAATAVATKKGLWAVIAGFLAAAWKFVLAGVIGVFAWIGSLFKRRI